MRGFTKFAVNSLAEESSKKEQRLIKQLEQVTEVRTKYLAKMAEADSLIGVSDTLLSSLSEQMHLASQEMRAEAQRYAEEKKAVERMLVDRKSVGRERV